MQRLLTSAAMLWLASCASESRGPVLPPPLIDDPRQSYFIVSYADASTLRMAFHDAQRKKDAGELDGEVSESVALRLHALLLAAGDDLFVSSLQRETAAVQKTVADCISLDRLRDKYPKTLALLSRLQAVQ
jgi:hypothetical protein